MLRKVVHAATQTSHVKAIKLLAALAEVHVTREQSQRWTNRVGDERCTEVREQAEAYHKLPLPAQQQSPSGQVPQVACVQMDGGRMQIRDRSEASQDRDEHEGFWRESLVGCCLSGQPFRCIQLAALIVR